MEIIATPFGEIDLDIQPISFWITDSTIGTRRKVTYEGIRSQSESEQFANIVWYITQHDQDGNLINSLDAVQNRQVITPVSGQNRVNSQGTLIIRELFPEGEKGQEAFNLAWQSGHNEYKFWMGLLRIAPLPTVLLAGGNLLSQYQRFDRS